MRGTFVVVEVDEDGPHALLHFIGHRLPRVIEVPLAYATSLVARGGAKLVVRGTV